MVSIGTGGCIQFGSDLRAVVVCRVSSKSIWVKHVSSTLISGSTREHVQVYEFGEAVGSEIRCYQDNYGHWRVFGGGNRVRFDQGFRQYSDPNF
jgi:hypothetical protein